VDYAINQQSKIIDFRNSANKDNAKRGLRDPLTIQDQLKQILIA
jgi:hypothetical protein